jgi:AraC-like DNA-binding protein
MTLDNWPNHIEKHLFFLKDDFFELPFLFNSPSVMLSSLLKLPITKHNASKQSMVLDSAYCKTDFYYREIDEGFWILVSKVDVTKNIVTKLGFDKNKLSEYYLLTYSVFENKFSFKESEEVTLLSPYWTFSKPDTEISTYFFEGSACKVFSFVIKKDWANKNFSSKKFKDRKAIMKFLNGQRGSFTWLDIAPEAHDLSNKILETLENGTDLEEERAGLKKKSIKLMIDFFENSFEDNRILDNNSLTNLEYQNVAKAEKIILHNLHLPFVGIEFIAKEVNTSPTKLKSNFKTVFGFSMLQYHKERNMLLAMQLIQKSDINIQNIAIITGYDSPSRFASGFKKRFGKLPSEARL